MDVQDSPILVPENAEVPLVRKEVRESAEGWQRTLSREYNDMGLWAEPVLLLLAITGVVTLMHLTGILAICLQLGPKAYFHDGVRYVPHRAYSLTNGSHIEAKFQALSWIAWFVLMVIWVVVSFLSVIAANMLWKRIRRTPATSKPERRMKRG